MIALSTGRAVSCFFLEKLSTFTFENKTFTKDYFDASKRYIGNAIQIFFVDGSKTERIAIDFPVGHPKRRQEGIPILKKKFQTSIQHKLRDNQWLQLTSLYADKEKCMQTEVDEFMSFLVV